MPHIRDIDFYGVTVKNLSVEMRAKLREWREGVLDPSPRTKFGLWIHGSRCAGTTYVGKVIAGRMAYQEGFLSTEQVTAAALIRQMRASWTYSQQTRQHADDEALFYEARASEDMLDQYFFVDDLLMIDDLHDETVDWNFWRRHLQPLVEERVKAKRPTIVCTTLTPDDDSLPVGIVKGLFVAAHCSGFRPDRDAYPYDRQHGEG